MSQQMSGKAAESSRSNKGFGSTRITWQLWIIACGFFMQTLDTTIVNTALPSMAVSLHTNPLQMHLVIVAYVLTLALMLPASGWLADRFGIRRIFFSAIVLFTLGSLFCAQSQTLDTLILSRVVQGIGGAMMVPVGRLAVMKLVPREQYMAAMVFVTLPGQIGPLLGPTVGGALVQYASWHWIFLINLPVGIIGGIATLLLMSDEKMKSRRFDGTGFLLLAMTMVGLTLALDGNKSLGLSAPAITLLMIAGGLSLCGYWLHARRHPHALFPLTLFSQGTYRIGLLGSFAARIGSGMLPFMTPLFLQVALGFSPFHAGLMMILMVLGSMGMKRIIVWLVNRFGYRQLLVAATLGLAVISVGVPLTAIYIGSWAIPIMLFFQGMINSLRFSTMNTLTLKDLSDHLASSGNSLLSMIMQISMSLGVTTVGLLLGMLVSPTLLAGADSVLLITPGAELQRVFIGCYLCMSLIIALPALIFARIPPDGTTHRPLETSATEQRSRR